MMALDLHSLEGFSTDLVGEMSIQLVKKMGWHCLPKILMAHWVARNLQRGISDIYHGDVPC
jgi:hypothetical protein